MKKLSQEEIDIFIEEFLRVRLQLKLGAVPINQNEYIKQTNEIDVGEVKLKADEQIEITVISKNKKSKSLL